MTTNDNSTRRRGRKLLWSAVVVAIVLALVANGVVLYSGNGLSIAEPTPCPTVTQYVVAGSADNGLSAYELWKAVGNTGTVQDFLDSLVGEPGPEGDDGTVTYVGNDGRQGPDGETGASAYQLWLDQGNTGTEEEFLRSLVGTAGADGIDGDAGPSAYDLWILVGNEGTEADFIASLKGLPGDPGTNGTDGTCSVGQAGSNGADGAPGSDGSDGLSAFDLWVLDGGNGDVSDFLASLVGDTGATGATGPQGPAGPEGPAGTGGLGDTGSFYDVTSQGQSGTVSTAINTAYPVYLGETDADSTSGISVETGEGDATGRASFITFTHPGVYNIAFSGQIYRTAGGSPSVTSFWLRKDGLDVPATNTDVSIQSNSTKLVAAWNFFVPVSCTTTLGVTTCDTYQLMWSYDSAHTNLWYQAAQTNPTRPEIPSVILTVNQVR